MSLFGVIDFMLLVAPADALSSTKKAQGSMNRVSVFFFTLPKFCHRSL